MPQEYNVVIFDKPNAPRLEHRPTHVKNIVGNVESGIVKLGGALFKDEAKTEFAGSTLQVVANSREEVLEFLKTDIYAQVGVWDLDSVLIHPVGNAVRLPIRMAGVDDKFYQV
ncbi:uncharacterized protein CANTADRAFT_88910 [Suhomyces tanzawaensis NRRL Y-17324]|uniref:YCII-related domain-containing protein n=1 Tax=Suhomyces tanzawaensis NRRL Y-17324 TaxID=984487 RepID=A0A1E4SND0_9ASCO|nr:uncharacterized protein CANTADRAFT_88910 [Suhomyces tanzawaensis NRRL Y-17324]ODV81005.1 hypothetical protein CANTADRAFT_88910 [Suhomyces tanzawaensis NRRL Y-17324]